MKTNLFLSATLSLSLCAASTAQTLPAYLPADGLVGWWPFNGNANDESGNGNGGAVNGATLTEDRFGDTNAAYGFDGVDDYINYGDVTFLDNSTQATWNWWLKTDEILPITDNNEYVSVLRKDLSWIPMQFANDSYDYHRSLLFQGGIGSGNLIWDSTTIEYSVWSMYTISKTYNSMILYKNGVIVDSLSYTGEIENSSSPFLLGRAYTFNDLEAFNGQLDDIGIWNRALTADEVQQLYTLNACTFTIYDTLTTTLTETVFDTVMITETIFDTLTVTETVFDTIFVTEALFDTVTVTETLFITVYDTVLTTVTDTLIINTLITAVEPAQENTFLVYPNPASTQITINNGNAAILSGYTMRITNSLGQDVYNQNITQPELTLDLSSWSGNGLYVLYILDPQQNIIAVKQIVLQ